MNETLVAIIHFTRLSSLQQCSGHHPQGKGGIYMLQHQREKQQHTRVGDALTLFIYCNIILLLNMYVNKQKAMYYW